MVKLCECGCGEQVVKNNKYIHGHNRAGAASYTSGAKWSMQHECCVECGTTELKHVGRGLCTACHRRFQYEFRKTNTGKWSQKFDKCITCGTTERQHKANGRCLTCFGLERRQSKGARTALKNSWSRFSDKCLICGTTEIEHSANGLCMNCHNNQQRDLTNCVACPVCGVLVEKLNQHLTMKSKKCQKHNDYQAGVFKKYFESDLSLEDIVVDMGGDADRHMITRQFSKFFGRQETIKRNKAVKSCYCSENAAINYNAKNRFGTLVEIDSPNQGRVTLRSKLEADYANWLTKHNIDWWYEVRKFPYVDKNKKRRTYTPDFYITNDDRFIEIKGFAKDDDLIKLQAVKELGVVIDLITQKELQELITDANL